MELCPGRKFDLFKGILLAASSVAVWGSQSAVGRFLYGEAPEEFDAFSIAFYRFLLGDVTVFLFLLLLPQERPKLFSSLKSSWKTFLLLGFVGIAMEGSLQTLSLKYTSSGRSALFGAGAPLFTVLFARLLLKEPFNSWNTTGILLGLAGVVLILGGGGMDVYSTHTMLAGDLLALGSGLSWGLYTVLAVEPTKKYGPLVCTCWAMLFAAPLLGIPAAFSGGLCRLPSPRTVLCVLYLGIAASGFAIPAWAGASKYLSAGALGAFGYLSLALAILFSILFLGESFTLRFLAAFLLILMSLLLVLKGSKGK
ncbi:MAG: EamA family transporter [Lentisphaeria bacterium]|nr:EamA family transporter [Lentisphaeria bacterium]